MVGGPLSGPKGFRGCEDDVPEANFLSDGEESFVVGDQGTSVSLS